MSDRLIEEARSIAPMSEERDYIEGLCAALEDAEQEMKALRMALEISGERRETCERDRERLRAELQYVKESAQHAWLKWQEMVMVVPGGLEDAARGFDEDNSEEDS